MFVQAITWWLENGRPSSPREIATQTAKLAAAIIAEANGAAFAFLQPPLTRSVQGR
jgi:hypothetical protein